MHSDFYYSVLKLATPAAATAAAQIRGPKTGLIFKRGENTYLFYRIDKAFRGARLFPPHCAIRRVVRSKDLDQYYPPSEIARLERGTIGKCKLANLEKFAARISVRASQGDAL